MDFSGYKALRAQVAGITDRDVHLGRFLAELLLHVAHGNGLDVAQEQAKEDKQVREEARKQEDTQLQAEADARVQARAVEDQQTLTPDQKAARDLARKQEDERLQDEANARQQARADEDKRIADQSKADAAPATTVEPVQSPMITTEKGK